MSDAPVVHIGENSPEEVAYRLFKLIANLEKRDDAPDSKHPGWKSMDRKYVLETYIDCIRATRGTGPVQRT